MKLKQNFIYNTIYQFLLISIPLITTPYISRTIGAEGIGAYSYSKSIAYYFFLFAMLGLNNYGNRTVAMNNKNRSLLSYTFSSIYFMQLITSVIAISLYICCCYFNNDITLWIQLLYVISAAFDINWFFYGIEEFKLPVLRSTLIKLISFVSIFIFVKNSSDTWKYILIMTLEILMTQLIIWPFLNKYVDIVKVKFIDIFRHYKPNLILLVPVLTLSLYRVLDKVMIGYFSTITQVGYYENIDKIISVPLTIINSLGVVMLPRISNLISQGSVKSTNKYLKYSFLFAFFIVGSIGMGMIAVADYFIPLFYGEGFEACIPLLYVLMISVLFISIANVIRTQYLLPYKKDKTYLFSTIIGSIINIIVNAILIPTHGALGAAIATSITEFIVMYIQYRFILKQINIRPYLFQGSGYLFIGITMFIIVYLCPFLHSNIVTLLYKCVIGGIYYLLIAFIYTTNVLKIKFFKI